MVVVVVCEFVVGSAVGLSFEGDPFVGGWGTGVVAFGLACVVALKVPSGACAFAVGKFEVVEVEVVLVVVPCPFDGDPCRTEVVVVRRVGQDVVESEVAWAFRVARSLTVEEVVGLAFVVSFVLAASCVGEVVGVGVVEGVVCAAEEVP